MREWLFADRALIAGSFKHGNRCPAVSDHQDLNRLLIFSVAGATDTLRTRS